MAVGSIDTESLVTQLMAVERRPQDIMKTTVQSLQTSQNAWQMIADKLTALKTAADAMTGFHTLTSLRTVTSSDPTSVSVRTTGAGAATSASIDVVALAAAQSTLVSDTFAATTDSIGTRTLDLTPTGGTTHSFTSADGTIGGLAQAVNAANIGVSARVLQTSPGQYQLSLTSTASGTAHAFTAAGTGWGTFTVARPAADAQINVDGVTLTRSSNVISDVLDGVELTLSKTTTNPVVVTSARDDTTIIANVKAFVDAANALGSLIDQATATNTDPTKAGPLAGDYTARRYMDTVRDAIASSLVTSSAGVSITSADLGVTLDKTGTVMFDSTKLTASLATNSDAVLAALGQDASSTATGVSVIGITSGAVAGTKAISVTQAATQATLTGTAATLPPSGTAITMSIVNGSTTTNVSFATGATWTQTASNMSAAMHAAGAKVTATVQTVGGVEQGLNLTADRYGSLESFTVSGAASLGVDGAAAAGSDAAGTIGGVAFTARGQNLSTNGLVLSITLTPGQLTALGGTSAGNVTMTSGLAGALSAIGAAGGVDGSVQATKDGLTAQITDLQQRITDYDTTLAEREATLRAKFTAMQTMIANLNSMASSLGSLSTTTG